MKRIGIVLASFIFLVILTGCGSEKKLECSLSDEENGLYQTMNLSFDSKDLLKSGTIKQEIKLSEDMAPYLDTIKESAEEEFNSSDYSGMDVQITDNEKDTITVTIGFDAEEASKAMGEELDEDSDNYTSIKESLETEGYTCK